MHVHLASSATHAGPLTELVESRLPGDVAQALALGRELGALPLDDRDLWEALATLGAHDLGTARAIEPHLDAVGILRQAGVEKRDGSYGVFAAEGGDDPLTMTGGTLTGTKPWCSLAGTVDFALVTAHSETGQRCLYAVDLAHPGVRVEPGAWVARGLTEIPSGPVHFEAVPATPVGESGWYLDRPGFARGGIGVAACWFGGAVAIGRTVHAAASRPNPHLLAHLGAIDELLQSARRALDEAVDDRGDGRLVAKRVRSTVARACEEIIERASHALGPAPLALDEAHAKRVADLQLYVRQHHAERDQESLGAAIADGPAPW